MPRLEFDDYLAQLRSESALFRAALSDCDPGARVPGCPEWTAADLLWHLTEVQWFWSTMVRTRPASPGDDLEGPDRPAAYAELLAAFDTCSAGLLDELSRADPAETAWSWSAEQTVGFTFRRQAHEALVHRVDAEQTSGVGVSAIDAALAGDGVDEALDIMFGGTPPWGEFHGLPHFVRVDVTDADDPIWVQLGRFVGTDPDGGEQHDLEDISVVVDPGVEADAVVSGPGAALDLWLWRRGDDAEVTVTGDRAIYDRFRSGVDHPIN